MLPFKRQAVPAAHFLLSRVGLPSVAAGTCVTTAALSVSIQITRLDTENASSADGLKGLALLSDQVLGRNLTVTDSQSLNVS